jgi:hypothetical protein
MSGHEAIVESSAVAETPRARSTTPGQRCSPAPSDVLKVLIIAHVDRLAARLDRSQYFRYAALARHPGVILFGPGVCGYRSGMSARDAADVVCGGEWPDLILHGVDFKESGIPLVTGLTDVPCLTAIELQDSWTIPDSQAAFINRQRFDLGLILVRHHTPYYQERCPGTQFLWTPHAINTSLFHDHGLEKQYDVLLYGNLTGHTYPFRTRLADLLSRSNLHVRILAHPGYYPQQRLEAVELVTGAELSRVINQSRIAISTSSIYRCLMMKYFEIAASRCLIAGDMPEEGREIFGDDFLELSPEQSDGEIIDSLRHALADSAWRQARTDAAHRRILTEHSTAAFAVRLLSQLRQFVPSRVDSRTFDT